MKRNFVFTFIVISAIMFNDVIAQTTTAFRKNYNYTSGLMGIPGNITEGLVNDTYVMAGTNISLPLTGTVTQLNSSGNPTWSYAYSDASIGFELHDIKKDIVNNQYYLCGGSSSNAGIFMTLDNVGSIVTTAKFNLDEVDGTSFERIIKTSDGGYVLVGSVTNHKPGNGEIPFSTQTYTNSDGEVVSESIKSALIVKLDASGNHLWHHVFRYYLNNTVLPGSVIQNSSYLADVVEVADGYVAVGRYKVNHFRSATNSDGDDATPTDAILLKVSTNGTVTYHKQVDTPSASTSQKSKYLSAVNKTSAGDIIAAGGDNGKELIQKFNGSGGFSNIFSRGFEYSSSFITGVDPADVSQVYEVNGSTDLVTMAMYVKFGLPPTMANTIHRVNSTATANVWSKRYDFGLAAILPKGGQTSDGGFINVSTNMSFAGFQYHVIKTDPNGDTPLNGCAPTSFSPNPKSGPTTFVDPHYKSLPGTPVAKGVTIIRVNANVNTTTQCELIICNTPATPAISTSGATCTSPSTSQITNYDPSATYTFTPSGPTINASGTISNTTTGQTYSVTVTIDDCVSEAGAFTNNLLPSPSLPTISTTDASCSSDGITTITNYSNTNTYTFTPSGPTVGAGGQINNATPGQSYSFTVTNPHGCSSAAVNFTTEPMFNTPSAPSIGTISPTCTSDGSGSISGYNSSFTYTFSPSGPSVNQNGIITGADPGTTYTVTATSGEGCTSSSTSFTIGTQLPLPAEPVINTSAATCSADGSSVISNYNNGYTYAVSPSGPTISSNGSISGAIAGQTYVLTVTNPGNCSVTTTFVNPAQLDVPSISTTVINPSTCQGDGTINFTFTDVPDGTYTINYNGGQFTNVTVTNGQASVNAPAGSYSNLTINNGTCTSDNVANASLTDPNAPTSPTLNTVAANCTADGSNTISNYDSNITYTFTPAGPTVGAGGTINGATIGTTYHVTASENGCVSSTTSFVNEEQLPTPDAPTFNTVAASCIADGSNTITNYDSNNTYTFISSGPTIGSGGVINNANFGQTYTVTTTNSHGCISEEATFLTEEQYDAPTITASAAESDICEESSTTITATGGESYSWDQGVGTGDEHTVSPSTTTTYTVTGTDANGCENTASITVNVHEFPAVNAGNDVEICLGESTTLMGSGADTYNWDNGLGNGSSHEVSPSETTTYTLTGADDIGCENTHTVTVVVHPLPTITLTTSNDDFCSGESTVLTADGADSYSWDNGLGNGDSHEVTLSESTTYTVTGTDANGCENTSSITVNVNPLPTLDIQAESEDICQGSSTTITVSGADDYTWNNDLTEEASHEVTPDETTTYEVEGVDENGCINTAEITINVHEAPVIEAEEDQSICLGSEFTLVATGGETYEWDGLGEGDTHIISPTEETTYNVTGYDAYGCSNTDEITISVNPIPEINAEDAYSICLGSAVTLEVTEPNDDYQYSWYFNEEEIANGASYTIELTHQSDAGTYIVTAINEFGCEVRYEIELTIDICDLDITEVISPNGDGKNDYFYVQNLNAYPNSQVWIYNRWGAEVFQSDDYQNDWNGISQSSLNIGGNELPEGTYYYILKLGGEEGMLNAGEIYKGFVYIKR